MDEKIVAEIEYSEWQYGHPPHNGVWQIEADGWVYYAKFQNGEWSVGNGHLETVRRNPFTPYKPNNNPDRPIKWRGRLVNKAQ